MQNAIYILGTYIVILVIIVVSQEVRIKRLRDKLEKHQEETNRQ
jgi:hypothetical protein